MENLKKDEEIKEQKKLEEEEAKRNKFKQKFKNIFDQKILSATWEKEGTEVSYNNKINIYIIYYKR